MKNLVLSLLIFAFSSCEVTPTSDSSDTSIKKYRAYCQEKIPLGSHSPIGWCGELRDTPEKAEKDRLSHEKEYNHKSYSCDIPCPFCGNK